MLSRATRDAQRQSKKVTLSLSKGGGVSGIASSVELLRMLRA